MSVHVCVCVGFSSTAERAAGRETDGTGERPGRPFEELVNEDKERDGWKDRKAGLNVTCLHLRCVREWRRLLFGGSASDVIRKVSMKFQSEERVLQRLGEVKAPWQLNSLHAGASLGDLSQGMDTGFRAEPGGVSEAMEGRF